MNKELRNIVDFLNMLEDKGELKQPQAEIMKKISKEISLIMEITKNMIKKSNTIDSAKEVDKITKGMLEIEALIGNYDIICKEEYLKYGMYLNEIGIKC